MPQLPENNFRHNCSRPYWQGNFGFDGKAHVRQVDAHAAHGFKKIAGDAKVNPSCSKPCLQE
ncbi:MAG: hypothetical protein ACLSAH_11030 [Bilophila wadsworthia]